MQQSIKLENRMISIREFSRERMYEILVHFNIVLTLLLKKNVELFFTKEHLLISYNKVFFITKYFIQ